MDMNVHVALGNQFTSYSDSCVTISGIEYSSNIIVTNESVFDFVVKDIKQVTLENLAELLNFMPDLILFGTGVKIVYPQIELIKTLQQRRIGVEVMPIQALCRTFNFLVSEDRKVACILLF
mgnify:CR=1 FL=1